MDKGLIVIGRFSGFWVVVFFYFFRYLVVRVFSGVMERNLLVIVVGIVLELNWFFF